MIAFKRFSRFSLLFVFFYFVPSLLFSDDIKKADKLYQQLDYKYALEIYEKIMRTNPSLDVAERIANCYRFINNTDAAELWYKKVLEYPDATAKNYQYCANALKQNGKYDEAMHYYILWGQKDSASQEEASRQANMCTVAKTWTSNPDIGATITNEIAINSSNSDFSPVLLGDDLLLISDRWQQTKSKEKVYGWTGNPFFKIYHYSQTGGIRLLEGNLNKGYHSGPLAVYPSQDTLIFTRAEAAISKKNSTDPGKQHLIIAVKKNSKWTEKSKIPFNKKGEFSVLHPALSPDGNILYFASDMPGGFGGMDLYYAEKQAKGEWSNPINCGAAINTAFDDVFPTVRADGKFYFSSKGHIGMGGLDIFSADGSKNSFSNVENLRAPLNSPKDDFGITFNKDLKTGYLSSNRSGGVGLDDIYRFKIGVKAEPKKEVQFAVNGVVIDKSTSKPLAAIEVVLVNLSSGSESRLMSDSLGKFTFPLVKEADYIVRGNPARFFTSQSGSISTKGLTQSTIFDVKFELERSADVYTVKLNNIFFNFNRSDIRPDAIADLNKVNAFMKDVPGANLELLSHTDSRGSDKYNQILSQKRANSTKNYLVHAGTAANRLVAIGKGETELINQCANGVKCTEAQHQLNRRTEFKIVKVKPIETEAVAVNKHK
jgi:outer membrane protein OmpA-like peptidoglycan-associated protein